MLGRAGLLLITLAALSIAAAAQRPDQRPPVTFRSEINFVEIDAIVTDREGRFVANLSRDDFRVVEEGKPQAISTFSLVRIPIERRDSTGVERDAPEPDVATNRRAFDGRIFMLLLDDLQTDLSRTHFVRTAARAFVERHVSDNDLVAVTFTGSRSDAQDFTSSRSRLVAAIDRFAGRKLKSKTAAMIEQKDMARNVLQLSPDKKAADPEDPYAAERHLHARSSLGVLERMSGYLGGIHGRRKALVYFGEGIDHELVDKLVVDRPSISQDVAAVRQSMRDAVAAATRANVSVYTIDPRGLSTGQEAAIGLPTVTSDPRSELDPRRMNDEMNLSHLWMRAVTDETGGIPFLNTNDTAAPLARIIDDSSSYYIIGYYAPAGRRDGRFRRVEVSVTRPSLEVRARKGYYAPGAGKDATAKADLKTSAELREAMRSPIPIDTLGFAAAAVAFKGSHPHVSVALAIEVDPAKLAFTRRGDVQATDLELEVSASDPGAKTAHHASHHVAELRLRPETYESVRQEGVRITRRLELRPGRYRLHLGLRDATSGAIGTLLTDLDVPDFTSPALAISGIALVSAAATRTPTVESDRALTALLPGDQTARREFPQNDTLAVFAEIYDNDLSRPHLVTVTSSVRDENSVEVFAARAEHTSAELAMSAGGTNQPGGFGHRVTIPAARLGTGRFVLRVLAQRSIDDAPVLREVPFRIR
jgi:VWFA-related protein